MAIVDPGLVMEWMDMRNVALLLLAVLAVPALAAPGDAQVQAAACCKRPAPDRPRCPCCRPAALTAAPDVLLMMDREGDLAIANADVLAHPALAQTPAAETGAIIRMDGMLMLGFGPRTPQAAADLFAALYPDLVK